MDEADNQSNLEEALKYARDFSQVKSKKKKIKSIGEKPLKANPMRASRNLLK